MTTESTTQGRILVVDDTPTNLLIMEEILSERYQLVTVSSGEEALKVVGNFRPDLILMDIMMPGMSGYDVCRSIRDDAELRNTKIIMVSAKALVSERLEGYRAGANDYITKPFEEEELLAKVQVFLQLKFAEELIEARRAGMSEVAAGVLHNVGNVLNSINTAAWQARSCMMEAQITSFAEAARAIADQSSNWEQFATQDDRGKMIPEYLMQMASHLEGVRDEVLSELAVLKKNVEHVRKIISVQQDYARVDGVTEVFEVREIVEDALHLNRTSLGRHGVRVVREFDDIGLLKMDRHKLLQIITNLVVNAKDALVARESPDPTIVIRIRDTSEGPRIEVRDNGEGIAADQIERIFQHGFTTKRDGHGFGLHSAALFASELGGSLCAHSDGPGTGASFQLDLPSQARMRAVA